MNNPFTEIEARLSSIESLLLDIKDKPTQAEPESPKDQLLTVEETANYLFLSVPTIYGKVSRNELPVMKRGKRLYFSRTELMEYLKDGRKKTNAEIEAEAENYLKKKGGNNG